MFDVNKLDPNERHEWNAAIAAYRVSAMERQRLYDDENSAGLQDSILSGEQYEQHLESLLNTLTARNAGVTEADLDTAFEEEMSRIDDELFANETDD